MPPDPRKLLYDVASACTAIAEFCHGRLLQDYEADLMLRSACERQFEIIGEAMTRIRDQHDQHRDIFDGIDRAADIITFRNRLIHGYDTVDSEIVWDVIQTKLPDLGRVVRRQLEQTG